MNKCNQTVDFFPFGSLVRANHIENNVIKWKQIMDLIKTHWSK